MLAPFISSWLDRGLPGSLSILERPHSPPTPMLCSLSSKVLAPSLVQLSSDAKRPCRLQASSAPSNLAVGAMGRQEGVSHPPGPEAAGDRAFLETSLYTQYLRDYMAHP